MTASLATAIVARFEVFMNKSYALRLIALVCGLASLLVACPTPPAPQPVDFTLVARGGTINFGEDNASAAAQAFQAKVANAVFAKLGQSATVAPQAINGKLIGAQFYVSILDTSSKTPLSRDAELSFSLNGNDLGKASSYTAGFYWDVFSRSPIQSGGNYGVKAKVGNDSRSTTAQVDVSDVLPQVEVTQREVFGPSFANVSFKKISGANEYLAFVVNGAGEVEKNIQVNVEDRPNDATFRINSPTSLENRQLVVIANNFSLIADSKKPYPGALPAQFKSSVTITPLSGDAGLSQFKMELRAGTITLGASKIPVLTQGASQVDPQGLKAFSSLIGIDITPQAEAAVVPHIYTSLLDPYTNQPSSKDLELNISGPQSKYPAMIYPKSYSWLAPILNPTQGSGLYTVQAKLGNQTKSGSIVIDTNNPMPPIEITRLNIREFGTDLIAARIKKIPGAKFYSAFVFDRQKGVFRQYNNFGEFQDDISFEVGFFESGKDIRNYDLYIWASNWIPWDNSAAFGGLPGENRTHPISPLKSSLINIPLEFAYIDLVNTLPIYLAAPPQETASTSFTFYNSGNIDLNYTTEIDPPNSGVEITVGSRGTVRSGQSTGIGLVYNCGANKSDQAARVVIKSNDILRSQLPVEISVECAPNLVLSNKDQLFTIDTDLANGFLSSNIIGDAFVSFDNDRQNLSIYKRQVDKFFLFKTTPFVSPFGQIDNLIGWSKSGGRLAISDAEGSAKVIDLMTGNVIRSFIASPIVGLRFVKLSDDGKYLIVVNNNSKLEVIEVNTGALRFIKSGVTGGATLSPDNKMIAYTAPGGVPCCTSTLFVDQISTGNNLFTYIGKINFANDIPLSWSSNSQKIAFLARVINASNTQNLPELNTFNFSSGSLEKAFLIYVNISSSDSRLSLSTDGSKLTIFSGQALYVLRTSTGRELLRYNNPSFPIQSFLGFIDNQALASSQFIYDNGLPFIKITRYNLVGGP
jgi:hypothetical protein